MIVDSPLGLQRRHRELGRLRMGAKSEKNAPKKLSEWRITSSSRELLERAAECYGGEVREWTDAPTEGTQWELFTGTDRLDVLVPPGEPLSQAWELWSRGGCQRRCNGAAQTTGEECVCPDDLTERLALAQKGKACKATTRLSVVLPRVPDIGVWRLETHGLNAAVELPSTVDLLRAALAAGQLIPAELRIEGRTKVKDGQTNHYTVPVLGLPTVTTAQLMAGETFAAPAIEAPAVAALPAAPVEPAPPAKRAARATKTAAKPEAPLLPGEDELDPPVSNAERKRLEERIAALGDTYAASLKREWQEQGIASLRKADGFTPDDYKAASALVAKYEDAKAAAEAPFDGDAA